MLTRLYEDEEILVVDKPSGLASQPGEGIGISVIEAVERDFGYKPWPVHRLDRQTAGCLVLARNPQAARIWSARIASKEVRRGYQAISFGIPAAGRGTIETPVTVRGAELPARTSWRLLETFDIPQGEGCSRRGLCLLALDLGTGRTHQIRIHLASIGLPIVADDRHGDFACNREAKARFGAKKLMLWAASLRLPGGRILESTMPEHMAALIDRVRRDSAGDAGTGQTQEPRPGMRQGRAVDGI